MSTIETNTTLIEEVLLSTKISDLVGSDPGVMEILAPLGLDLCCGGGHPLGEALKLHGIASEEVVPQLLALGVETVSDSK